MVATDSRAEKQVLRMERKMSKMDAMRFSREEVMDDIFEGGGFFLEEVGGFERLRG